MAQILIGCRHIKDGTLPSVCVRCGDAAVTKRFPGLGDPAVTSWFLSPRMRVLGLLSFWAYILLKTLTAKDESSPGGLPLCERHRNYWPRRAWFMVVGFLGMV